MKKTFLILSITTVLFSCGNKTSQKSTDIKPANEVEAIVQEEIEPTLVGTEWAYSDKKGTSTTIFYESTFKTISDFSNYKNESTGSYTYEHPKVILDFGDFVQEMFVEGDTIKMPVDGVVSILVRKK